MKIVVSTLALLILSGCCSLVFAADSFGPRFGSTAPYALQNDLERAQGDVRGFGLDDLNDIAPAAGEESPASPETQPDAVFDEESEDELYYTDEPQQDAANPAEDSVQ